MTLTAETGIASSPYAAAGELTYTNDITMTGDLTVEGDFTFGNATTDTLTITGVLEKTGTWTAGLNYSAIAVGSYGTPLALGAVSDHYIGQCIHLSATVDDSSNIIVGHYRFTPTADSDDMIAQAVYGAVSVVFNMADAYGCRGAVTLSTASDANQLIGVMGNVYVSAAATLDATGGCYGVYGSVAVTGSGTADRNIAAGYFTMRPNTVNTTGQMSCVVADMGGSGYADYGFLAQVGNNNVEEAAIGIKVSDSAVLASGIKFARDTAGSITHAFEFEAVDYTPITADSGTPGANSTHKIAIDVGGTTAYIAVYADY